MEKSQGTQLAVMLRGQKGVELRVFLLTFAEYLAERGHNVVYITDALTCIPPPLHGLTRKADAFSRIHFRYLSDQTQLFATLFDVTFYEKLSKNPHTIIVDGVEKYCENPDLKDVAKLSAALLGATPHTSPAPDVPRLVCSLTYDPDLVTSVTLNACELFYNKVWEVQQDSSGVVSMKGSKEGGDVSTLVQFDSEEVSSTFGQQQLLKLKKIMHISL